MISLKAIVKTKVPEQTRQLQDKITLSEIIYQFATNTLVYDFSKLFSKIKNIRYKKLIAVIKVEKSIKIVFKNKS